MGMESCGGDGNVLELYNGDGCTTIIHDLNLSPQE